MKAVSCANETALNAQLIQFNWPMKPHSLNEDNLFT